MTANVIKSDYICDYCKHKYDYYNTRQSCRYWFSGDVCRDAEDFEGLELIEVEE